MILGLDIGTYAVKGVLLDPKKRYQMTFFGQERILTPHDALAHAPSPKAQAQAGEDEPWGEEATDDWSTPLDEPPQGEGPTEFGAPVDSVSDLEPDALREEATLEGWEAALSALLTRMGRDGEGAVVALPSNEAVVVKVLVPFDDASKVARILPDMLDDKLSMGRNEVVYDFKVQSIDEEAHEALVGYAKRVDVSTFLAELDALSVNPSIVTVPEHALRFVAERHIPQAATSTFALLDIGHETTRVLVMTQGRVALSRTILFGGKGVTEAIARVFDTPFEKAEEVKHTQGAILDPSHEQDPSRAALSRAIIEAFGAMARDLRRTFQSLYARQHIELHTIYVTGGGSAIANLTGWLTGEFGGVEVRHLDVSQALDSELPPSSEELRIMPMALSLAYQRLFDRGSTNGLNLRQGNLSYKGRSSFLRAKLMRLGLAAALLLVLLGVAMFFQWRDIASQRTAMRTAVAKETSRIFGDPVWRAKDIEERATSEAQGESGFVPKMSAYQVLYEVSAKLEGERKLDLRRIEVDADRNLIQIYGTTTTPQEVDQIVQDLEVLECLKSIKKDKLQVKSDTEVNFELQIASACS